MDKKARSRLRKVVTQARQLLEEDIKAQLRRLGIEEGGKTLPAGRLAHLRREDKDLRNKILAAIQKEQVRNVKRSEAYDRYVQHVGFTYLNRLAALRAMEVRGLIKETVIRRDQYAGMSRREYEISERDGISDREEVTKRSLLEAFTEVSKEIKVLFDVNDEYSLLFPSLRVLNNLISLLGEEVPEEDWKEEEIIGWIYQYYNSEARSEFRKRKKKPRPDDIPVINQFYTPRWLVRALVDNTLGRLWLEMKRRTPKPGEVEKPGEEKLRKPQGGTVDEYCSYLIPSIQDPPPREKKSVREIKVLDPACGSGHFLVYAFNVLYRMYLEDEPETPQEEIPRLILENNLFGIDVDLRAVQLAALSLFLKAKEYNRDVKIGKMNLVCADVRITDGNLQKEFISRLQPDVELQKIFVKLFTELDFTYDIGSLLKVRTPFERLLEDRRKGIQTRLQPKIVGQSFLSRKGGTGGQSKLSVEVIKQDVLVKPAATLEEMFNALLEFEREGMEKKDMGTMLFAAETEKSVGLLSLLMEKYDVILMNPPYGLMPKSTKKYVKEHYPRTHFDYYAAFIEQAIELCVPNGFVGALTGRTFMFNYYSQKLRQEILWEDALPELVLDLGFNVLDEATARYAAFTLRRRFARDNFNPEDHRVTFLRLLNLKWDEKLHKFERLLKKFPNGQGIHIITLGELASIPQVPYAYWTPRVLRTLFQKFPPLDRDLAKNPDAIKIADVKQGLATSDDNRFLRFWWEVPTGQIATSREETFEGKKWVPYSNDVYLFYFYADLTTVVNWEKDGEELRNLRSDSGKQKSRTQNTQYYFSPGLSWSVSLQRSQLDNVRRIQRIPFRILPSCSIFGVAAQGVIIDYEKAFPLLSVCCSKLVYFISRLIVPDKMPGTGPTGLLPIALPMNPSNPTFKKLSSLAHEAHDLLLEWSTGDEPSTRFIKPWILQVRENFDYTERPITGHPFAKEFKWSTWPSAKEIRAIQGSNETSIINLAQTCKRRLDLLENRIQEILKEIDDEVYRIYGITDEDRKLIEREMGSVHDEGAIDETEMRWLNEVGIKEFIERLISFYIKQSIENDDDGIVVVEEISEDSLVEKIRKFIALDFGAERTEQIEQEIVKLLGKPLYEWIVKDYFDFHRSLYRNRPIFWHLTSANFSRRTASLGAFNCFIYYHKLSKDTIPKIRTKREYLKGVLDRAKWKLQRLRRELQAAKESGDKRRERQLREEYEKSLDELNELQAFDEKLAEVSNPRDKPTQLDEDASWVEKKIAEVRDNGWNPVLDYGVRVNIEPLKEAGLLHRAAERVK